MKRILFFIFMLINNTIMFGADRYWLGTTTSFNSTSNWSTTSGGASGASVPGSSDIAIFNLGGVGNCTFDVNVNVAGISVLSTYTGIISQGAFTFTIGTSNATFSGGTFTGGSQAITSNGTLTISGTAFTSTSNTLTINNAVSFVLSNGSFSDNGGTVNIASGAKTITGNITFNNLIFTGGPTSVTISNTLIVTGTLTIAGGFSVTLNNGTIEARGDISITSTSVFGGGTGTLLINGTNNQTMTGPGTTDGQGRLPNVTINKSSGTLNLVNTISVAGDWTYTDGTVSAGTSRIFFYTTGNIDATGTSSTMTFYNLRINGTSIIRTLLGNITVSNNFDLAGSASVLLNGYTCNITASATTGISTTVSNYFVSESTNNSGKIIWNIGSTTGSYVFPFGTASGNRIPFTFQLTSGNAGNVTVSTYPTASNNTPYPISPDSVKNVDRRQSDNSSNVIDRFWQIDKDGASGTATLTYTYHSSEVSGGVVGNESLLVAQRYNKSDNSWDSPLTSQTASSATKTVIEPSVTLFSPRTLAISSSILLPITLQFFNATLESDNSVKLKWATTSETNNDFFTIEQSSDGYNWVPIISIDGAGNSSQTQHYETTHRSPLLGISYYRLKQTDFNGEFEYSKIITVSCGEAKLNDIKTYPNPATNELTMEITGNMESVNFEIINSTGEVVYKGNFNEKITLQTSSFEAGIYLIKLTNEYNSECKKLIKL